MSQYLSEPLPAGDVLGQQLQPLEDTLLEIHGQSSGFKSYPYVKPDILGSRHASNYNSLSRRAPPQHHIPVDKSDHHKNWYHYVQMFSVVLPIKTDAKSHVDPEINPLAPR